MLSSECLPLLPAGCALILPGELAPSTGDAALLCHESVLLVHDCVRLLSIDCALLLPAYDVGGDRMPGICEKRSSGSGGMGGAGGTSTPRGNVAKRRGDMGREVSAA